MGMQRGGRQTNWQKSAKTKMHQIRFPLDYENLGHDNHIMNSTLISSNSMSQVFSHRSTRLVGRVCAAIKALHTLKRLVCINCTGTLFHKSGIHFWKSITKLQPHLPKNLAYDSCVWFWSQTFLQAPQWHLIGSLGGTFSPMSAKCLG